MGLVIRKVVVIMILMDHGNRFAGIDDRDASSPSRVDHPIIPPRSAQREGWDILKQFLPKDEVIAAHWRVS